MKLRLFKDALKEGVKLGMLGVFVAAILGLPLHEAVLAGGDGARLGGGQVAHDAHLIVDEQGRNLVHVVAQLPVGGGGVRLLAGGGLELHHHQRQAVDKQYHVGPLLAVFHHRPLVDDYKAVVLRALVVHQVHQARALLALHHELDRHAVLQIVGKDHVFLQEGAGGEVFELIHRIVQRRLRQGGVHRSQRGQKLILIQGRVVVTLDVRAVGIGVAQGLGKELQDGVFIVGFGEGHDCHLLCVSDSPLELQYHLSNMHLFCVEFASINKRAWVSLLILYFRYSMASPCLYQARQHIVSLI